jgi:Cu(I)/Ag(I) efflux system protein CusF
LIDRKETQMRNLMMMLVLAVAAGPLGAQTTLADGEIRKVDKEAKKLTIRHGPIPSLDMPPMTMVFQVKDPALLEQVKAGDKVKFEAEKTGGAYIVTRIEK